MDLTEEQGHNKRHKWHWTSAELVIPKLLPAVVIYFMFKLFSDKSRTLPRSKKHYPTPFLSSMAFNLFFQPSLSATNPPNFVAEVLAREWLKSTSISLSLTKRDVLQELKTELAGFLERRVTKSSAPVVLNKFILSSGVDSALEILSYCLSEKPGDAFLVISPFNQSFLNREFSWRSRVRVLGVPCLTAPEARIDVPLLENAWARFSKEKLKIRALVVSNPLVSVGKSLSNEVLCDLVDFVSEKNIHLICNESSFAQVYRPEEEFTSILEVIGSSGELIKDRVHAVYEVGIAGFNAGVIYSSNTEILQAAHKMAETFSPVSWDVQTSLVAFLSDAQFAERYVKECQRSLARRYKRIRDQLEATKVVYVLESNAGGLCLVRFKEKSHEKMLKNRWESVLKRFDGNVPASAFVEKGQYCLSFAHLSDDAFEDSLEKINALTESLISIG